MGGVAEEIVLSWFAGGVASEANCLAATTDVEALSVGEVIAGAINRDGACGSNVDDAELASLAEVVGAQCIGGGEC